jgi:hypothetical protein
VTINAWPVGSIRRPCVNDREPPQNRRMRVLSSLVAFMCLYSPCLLIQIFLDPVAMLRAPGRRIASLGKPGPGGAVVGSERGRESGAAYRDGKGLQPLQPQPLRFVKTVASSIRHAARNPLLVSAGRFRSPICPHSCPPFLCPSAHKNWNNLLQSGMLNSKLTIYRVVAEC